MVLNNSTFNIPSWSSLISDIYIPDTIAVYGNGKVLGLTCGNGKEYVLGGWSGGTYAQVSPAKNTLPYNVTTSNPTLTNNAGTFGIIQSDIKSGIVAKSNSITKTTMSANFIIKY